MFVVIFGRPGCPYCVRAVELSEKLAAQKLERLEANIEFMDNLKEVNNET